ncbi:unnamed protein product [Boreogadus saida]
MSRKKLAWANKEVETFVCILGEEDVVYDVYVAAAAIDIRPTTTKGTVGSGNATSELSWANRSLPTAPLRSDPFRTLQWKCGISCCGNIRRGSNLLGSALIVPFCPSGPSSALLPIWCPSTLIVPLCPSGPSSALPVPF